VEREDEGPKLKIKACKEYYDKAKKTLEIIMIRLGLT
jgi:hypothetical protein